MGVSIIVAVSLFFRDEWTITSIGVVFVGAYALWLLFVTLSVLWSPSESYAMHKILRLWTVVPWAVVGVLIIGQSYIRFNRFLRLLVFSGLCVTFLIVFQYVTGGFERGFAIGKTSYLLPTRVIGASGLILLYWMNNLSRQYRLLLLALIAVEAVAILLSGSRGAFIALVSAIGVYSLMRINHRRQFHLQLPSDIRDIMTFGVVGLISFIPVVQTLSVDLSQIPAIRRTLRLFISGQTETSLRGRLEYYQSAIDLWMDSPVIGHGIGSFGVLDAGEDVIHYPHNIVLEILAELGLVGLILTGVIVGVSALRLYSHRKTTSNGIYAFLVAFVVFWFVSACLSFDLEGNRYFFVSLAILCASVEVVKNE